jgi:hypothetical protein
MGVTKNYLLNVLQQCSEEKFGQDAIEWGIVTGRIQLTGDLQNDVRAIFQPRGEPMSNCCSAVSATPHGLGTEPFTYTGFCSRCHEGAVFQADSLYDEVCEGYQKVHRDIEAQTAEAMQPLLEEILRPRSLAERIPEQLAA